MSTSPNWGQNLITLGKGKVLMRFNDHVCDYIDPYLKIKA